MARKKVSRNLEELPVAATIGVREHRTDRLLEVLRHAALGNQREQSQAFYSVREVAKRFRMPLSTVSQVYSRLEEEGLLSRVRGSKTVLQGSSYNRQLSVKGFVGLPASLSRFVTIQDYRMFFITLRRKLRLRGFATTMLFFEQQELEMSLADRLKAYGVDTVLWLCPPPRAKQTLLILSDLGIRIAGISEGDSTDLPCRYHLSRERAVEKLLLEWKREGICSVAIADSRQHPSPPNEGLIQAEFRRFGVKARTIVHNSGRTDVFVRQLTKSRTDAIIFPSASLASLLCFRRPAAATGVFRTKRVALIGGPVNMPFTVLPSVKADVVTFDWPGIATTLVDDLVSQRAFRRTGPTAFEANLQMRAPLNKLGQNI